MTYIVYKKNCKFIPENKSEKVNRIVQIEQSLSSYIYELIHRKKNTEFRCNFHDLLKSNLL